MKYIGLISDTHGYLDPKVFHYFKDCDEIWHAGDVGSVDLYKQLESFRPVKAVYGNIDGGSLRQNLTENLVFDCEGIKILISHIAGSPGKYPTRIKKLLDEVKPGILVCGHSHILKVISDQVYTPLLYINPGAAGIHGFHKIRTLLRFKIDSGKIFDMQVIELGSRSEIKIQ